MSYFYVFALRQTTLQFRKVLFLLLFIESFAIFKLVLCIYVPICMNYVSMYCTYIQCTRKKNFFHLVSPLPLHPSQYYTTLPEYLRVMLSQHEQKKKVWSWRLMLRTNYLCFFFLSFFFSFLALFRGVLIILWHNFFFCFSEFCGLRALIGIESLLNNIFHYYSWIDLFIYTIGNILKANYTQILLMYLEWKFK